MTFNRAGLARLSSIMANGGIISAPGRATWDLIRSGLAG